MLLFSAHQLMAGIALRVRRGGYDPRILGFPACFVAVVAVGTAGRVFVGFFPLCQIGVVMSLWPKIDRARVAVMTLRKYLGMAFGAIAVFNWV